jgi:thiol:disulfide interchange protein
MNMRWLALVVVMGVGLSALSAQTTTPKYVPVTKYDPRRNADQDIRDAVAEANRTHRRVLLEVGGEWCSWCHELDNYFDAHRDLTALRDRNFVTVKVNFSEENQNREVLARYPPIAAYPHLFVLDSDGKFLHSQGTSPLESGRSYDLERLTDFLTAWGSNQTRK